MQASFRPLAVTLAAALALALNLAAASAMVQTPSAPSTPDPPVIPAPPPDSAPQPGASAPGARPPVRKQSATEERGNAAMPGELRPEHPVIPQIKLPISRGARDPAGAGTGASSIDDGMARCKAIQPGPARSDCVRQARITAPSR